MAAPTEHDWMLVSTIVAAALARIAAERATEPATETGEAGKHD